MLSDFVRSSRGHWFEGQDVESGAFEQDNAAVYITANTELSKAGYEDTELVILRDMLNAEVLSCIELDLGHDKGSLALAWKIAQRMIDVWGGVIDDCRGKFWTAGSPVPVSEG
jgi:hypothetical protein